MTSRLTISWLPRSETTSRSPLWTFVRPGSTKAASTTTTRTGLVAISISHLKLSRKSCTHTKMTISGLAPFSVLSCSGRACRRCCSTFPLTPDTFPWATTMPDLLYAYSVWQNFAQFIHDQIQAKVHTSNTNNFQRYLWLPWSLISWQLRYWLSCEMECPSYFNIKAPAISISNNVL